MAAERRPTIRDVAAEADVSFKTVSRVVNREGGVSEELRNRVEAAIVKLGFRLDQRARGLRKVDGQPVTIGFVLVDLSNPFFSAVFRGIEEVAIKRECLVLAGSTEGSIDRERQLIDTFVGRRVDGLIVVTSDPDTRALVQEIDRGTPVVFLDIEPDLDSVDLVRSDHFAGTAALAEHLLAGGHTDIAYFGDDQRIYSAKLRLDGFLSAMDRAGITVADHRLVTASRNEEEWREIVVDNLNTHPHPTAVLSAQNFVTVGASRALHDLGLHHSIAQVGFDDVELGDIVEPAITVVTQRPRFLGRRAAEIVFSRLDGDSGPPKRQVIPVSLLRRGSGEIPARPTTS